MAVMILSLPLIVAYPLAVAAAIQRAGALARERRKAVEQAAGLREQLAHVARVGTLGEMAAGLAHELNQPLTAIHLEAATALELGGVDDMRSALSTVTEQALRAGGIVRRMRTFARQSWSNRELTSVEPIVRDVVGLLEHDLRLAGIETELVFDDAAHVVADRIEIEQVLVNLVRNASDAMSESRITHRQLTIRTAAGDGRVRVSVTDTGGGIPPAMQLHLFHPFQTTKSSGLGLGLSICQSIIEAHGGRIGAGPHPARGSLFFFELPAAELMKAAS